MYINKYICYQTVGFIIILRYFLFRIIFNPVYCKVVLMNDKQQSLYIPTHVIYIIHVYCIVYTHHNNDIEVIMFT